MNIDVSILQCPINKEPLKLVSINEVNEYIEKYTNEIIMLDAVKYGLINNSKTYFYPIFNNIIILLPVYALYIGSDKNSTAKFEYDKERVFQYYNEINYKKLDNLKIYADSGKWVDYRDVSMEYLRKSFTRAGKYIDPKGGKYFLDIASGPIGFPEYVDLSKNYKTRICIDISVNALLGAKENLKNQDGIFICGDITNIPLNNNTCDVVVSQHTLFHIPKKEQKIAVFELYRVAKQGSKVIIVYNWYWHSLFMSIAIFPYMVYSVTRHYLGKLYVKLFKGRPRLYFYSHSPRWFKKLGFGDKLNFYCWRSTNKIFLNLYIHKFLFGKKILNCLSKLEDKHPKFFGRFGIYPVIIIEK
ncbi:MAG: methyltransferase domain-containing protein [Bacteroidales bacterium]|nr:methyltransferase domain-containing protein [Bacteroidales bacterium]